MDLGLARKTAIVTGGAGGIGREIVRGLAREGCQVGILEKNEALGRTVAEQVTAETGVAVACFGCDLTQRASVEAAFAASEARFGNLQVLINSHQLWPHAWFTDITDEQWNLSININLSAYFVTCQLMVRHMLARNLTGSILNITSQAAFRGATSGHAHYAAAKSGLLGLTKSIAREVAKKGITVNGLAPGMARTPATAGTLAENEATYLERIPLGRIADPNEVADVAIFLVSERARYMTGATVDISGGMLMLA
jgi:3-oxoacyl-[acyl-carrier protein] reductase